MPCPTRKRCPAVPLATRAQVALRGGQDMRREVLNSRVRRGAIGMAPLVQDAFGTIPAAASAALLHMGGCVGGAAPHACRAARAPLELANAAPRQLTHLCLSRRAAAASDVQSPAADLMLVQHPDVHTREFVMQLAQGAVECLARHERRVR